MTSNCEASAGAEKKPIKGVGAGTLITGEPMLPEPRRAPGEKDEVFKHRLERYERWKSVTVDVYRGERGVVQLAKIAVEAMEADIGDVEEPKKGSAALKAYATAVAAKVDELHKELRVFLSLKISHPRTKKELGNILSRIHGLVYEDIDIGPVDLATKDMMIDADREYVLDALADLELLEAVAGAVIRLQDPTRAQKN